MADKVVVLVLAAGARWESAALARLGAHPRLVVLKRCVDVADLLATAASGQAGAAAVDLAATGLDAAATDLLRHHGVRAVGVVADDAEEAGRLRAARIGVAAVVTEGGLDALPDALLAADQPAPGPTAATVPAEPTRDPDADGPGRVVTVWGPAGAPGRTTVALGLAAELARRRRRTLLLDADPWGGTVGQALGILDEVSGLLSAARLAGSGLLAERFASVERSLGGHLGVVTGLPRADRWAELRPGAAEAILGTARRRGTVVVDTGFSLEDDPGADLAGRPGRNQLTLAAIDAADDLVVVGTPDPVGLARLARGLADLADLTGGRPVHVVVNRMRPGVAWGEREVAALVARYARPQEVWFLPDDVASCDRALVTGRTLVEAAPERPLATALGALAAGLVPPAPDEPVARVRRRTAGRARRS
ncbi:hypothetical protein [Nocardioides sp. SYSU D00038]|uniref:AAA family ATPase n=1 Tax=Nocardioides sp. SYSU D00038 TaxID=2812554 RepID=UPI001968090E|nr:hypothetical protein [Nocardioides sp. SYSU D00038]